MNGASALAAVFVALYAAHQVGDHWVQTGRQAACKGDRGWAGRVACAGHVLTLTATKAAFLAAMMAATGLHLSPAWTVLGLAVDAASHYWADRRFTLAWLARAAERVGVNGKSGFYRLGAPRPGRDDNPSLGTGAYALDQSWHIGWLFVAALIAAAGAS
jgi:hypothetical protein